MAYYYVNQNAQPTGEHEVHKAGCEYLKKVVKRLTLGDFSNCHDAVREAKKHYANSDGCYYCCNECHTK